jgi:SAM-dependent methyltransferase
VDVASNPYVTGAADAWIVVGLEIAMRAILRGVGGRRQTEGGEPRTVRGLRDRLCGLAFAALYGPAARGYDRFTDWLFLGEWRRWQETIASYLPAYGTVVELGCGTGDLARRLSAGCDRWIAVERSSAMLTLACRALHSDNTMLIRADARALPIAGRTADLVIATFPAAFILDSRTWDEIRRVLNPGGTYVIVVTGRLRPDGLARRLRARVLDLAYGRRRDGSDAAQFPVMPEGALPGTWRWVPTGHGEALLLIGESPEGPA